MRKRFRLQSMMVQALTILSALQLFSEGVPGAEGSGEPYGISRGVVEGAARAGSALNPQQADPRELDLRSGVPALSQVTPTSAPSSGGVDSRAQVHRELPTCTDNNGLRGVLRYERIVDVILDPSPANSDIMSQNDPPATVLEKCQMQCLKDEGSGRTRSGCNGFDFIPGKKYSANKFTDSKCIMAFPNPNQNLNRAPTPIYKNFNGSYHYREICITGSDAKQNPPSSKDCPSLMYVMERHQRKSFMPTDVKEVNADSLEQCEQICLNQAVEKDPLMVTSVCRSGAFNGRTRRCFLSTFTRRTHSTSFQDDRDSDYFENTCLNVERRCPHNKLFWTFEQKVELTGPFDYVVHLNITLDDCQNKCTYNDKIFCRSLEYDKKLKTCVLADEDSFSRPNHIKPSASEDNVFYELTCFDRSHKPVTNSLVGNDPYQLDSQYLTDRGFRKVQTAFQLFRHRTLELSPGFREKGREGNRVTLAECLDACLEETSFKCRSAIYSHRSENCRLSEFDQINGNLEFNPEYHYFENLMSGGRIGSTLNNGQNSVNQGGIRPGNNNFNDRFESNSNRFGSSGGFNDRFGSSGGGTNNFGSSNNFGEGFNDGNRFNQGGFNNRGQFQNSGGNTQTNTGRPLPGLGISRGPFSQGGNINSGGTFGNNNRLSSTENRFSTDRFGSNFGDNRGGIGNRGINDNRGVDRFSNAFNRFNENNLGGGSSFESSSRGSPSIGLSGAKKAPGGSRLTGVDLFAGGSSGGSVGFNRKGPGNSGGNRFSGSNSFGGGSSDFNRFGDSSSGGNRFGSSGSDGNRFGSSSSGGNRFGSSGFGGNRFGSSGSGGNRFGDSSSSGFTSGGGSGSFGSSNSFGSSGSFGSSFGSSGGTFATRSPFVRPGFSGLEQNRITDEVTEVTQQCNPDGSMDFNLQTVEPFRGRIYTFGYYDRCFYRGGGATFNTLRITQDRAFPDCGTTRYADTTSNIVVVQFADGVMTSMDKRYNLTCTTIGPGDHFVTSSFIGAGLGNPVPIEYIPEESRLGSQVRLQILHNGRPTTAVAVGDPLTIKIESLAGRGLASNIFATQLVARDPITGRAIQLIDERGCPVQQQVFPALGRARHGEGLEARFSAFKIPTATMMLFEAMVRVCKGECEPAVCNSGRGRNEVYSYGKRRRRRSADEDQDTETASSVNDTEHENDEELFDVEDTTEEYPYPIFDDDKYEPEGAQVNEVLRVYMSEEEANDFRDIEAQALAVGVCIPPSQYYSLLSALLVSIICLMASVFVMGLCFRKHRKLADKNAIADASNPHKSNRSAFPGSHPRTVNQPARYFPSRDDRGHSTIDLDTSKNRFPDPSEPIYTDPTLFERSPEGSREQTSARL